MSTDSTRALIRLLVAAFLLLPANGGGGRAHVREHRQGGSHPNAVTAQFSAALAAQPLRPPVDAGQPQPQLLLASEASLRVGRSPAAPAPTRIQSSICSCERTTGQAARPPPSQV